MVAPGVALCAKHVLEPLMSEIMSGSISVLCAGIRTDGLQLWRVKHVTLINDNDVAILGLVSASQIPQNHTYYHAVVDAQLPQVGENVRMFGFVHTAVPEASVITGSLMASQGDVLDRHDDRRDSVFIRWPSFAVDCHAVGGMSGGPVFNENGHLVGLLCTSFSAGDESGPAYVSALWPALTQVYLGGWPEPMFGGFHDLLSLSTEASIPQFEIVNSHLIEVFERDGERVTRYHVRT